MDELVFSTIGKLYIEVSRLQIVVESQQARIAELESQVKTPDPLVKSSSRDGGKP